MFFSSCVYVSLTLFETILLDSIVTAVIPLCIKQKKNIKLVNFSVAILILNLKEKQHFRHIMLYYLKKGKNATVVQKIFVQCMKKLLWLIKCVKNSLWNFLLEIFHWMKFHGQVDPLKLIVTKLQHWEQSMLYHIGDSQHTKKSKSGTENHLHQHGSVNPFDAWVPHTFLTIFPHLHMGLSTWI